MKRFLMIFALLLSIVAANAQVQYYRSTAYAQANVYNGRYVWSDWQSSNMTITINLNTDMITIYSPRTQIYRVVSAGDAYNDSNGGRQVSFKVIDQDGDRGTIRLRIESNGNSQIYVDFSNVAWVYNVVRTS